RWSAPKVFWPPRTRPKIRELFRRLPEPRLRATPAAAPACGSPKVRLPCIFNDFIKLPDARTGDAIRRLRRFQSPLPNSAAAWLSARARPSRALNGFGSDDNIGSSFSKSVGDDFHGSVAKN